MTAALLLRHVAIVYTLQQPPTYAGLPAVCTATLIISELSICYHRCTMQAYRKREYEAALGHYTAAIKLDSSNIAARNNRAMAYLALNMYQEAAADTAAVLEADPTNVKALLRQAAAHEGMGDMQAAAADCKRVLELEPKNQDAQQRFVRVQQQLGGSEQQQQQQPEFPPPPPEPQQV